MYGCGYESSGKNAVFFRIDSLFGNMDYFYNVDGNTNQLYCRGLTFDESTKFVSLLIVTDDNLLKRSSTSSSDSFIMVINEVGRVRRLKQITFSQSDTYTQTLGLNVLRRFNSYYIYAGTSDGFITKLQKEKFGTTTD